MVTQRIRSWRTPLAALMFTTMLFGASGSAVLAATAPLSPASANQAQSGDAPATSTAVCGPTAPGYARCMSLRRTDIAPRSKSAVTPLVPPSGYGPADLISAYALPTLSPGIGTGGTVAIIDAFDLPTAESDLATYRAQFGLTACTTANGCFKKVNQTGGTSPLPAPNSDWAAEIALDTDMASAICPNCKILLVEATTNSFSDLATAVNTAASLGAVAISNSYGGGEASGETTLDSNYDHPGIAVTASSGDGGYGVEYPAADPHVVAVGGTSLVHAPNARGWTETVWNGAGSGCSKYESKPAWQTDSGCAKRTVADVSAIADPNTGVAVYTASIGGWGVYGGTSVASPIIAATFALAGTPAAGTYPVTYPYAHPNLLNDVTSGSNGSCSPTPYLCTGVVGYDGPTGLGTPNGTSAFVPSGKPAPTVTYTGTTSAAPSAPITLSAHLAASGVGISGRTISFVLNGVTSTASTNASGDASVSTTAPATAGPYPIAVSFAGDGTYAAATTAATLNVSGGLPTPNLVYTGATSAASGASVTLKAKLSSAGTGISGRTVSFLLNGVTLTDATNINGVASVITTAPGTGGSYPIAVSFAGDGTYGPASTSATLTVTGSKPVPTLTYTGSTSSPPSAAITLSATLTSSGVGISGRTISFLLNGATTTAVTSGTGVASVGSTAPSTGGGYPISVTFAGDGTYAPASTSATLTVSATKKASVLRYTGNLQVRHGNSLVLKAKLTAAGGGNIVGDTVTFVFNGVTLTPTTSATGVASVTVTAPARGTYTVTASFAGDATYLPTSTSASINVT